ncbi:MAG: NADP-dependent malic enzyme [Crocinitomicaceae bacterium]|nr:NADP-dependent malic enzyme [Crocinitomicaceae bacterium]
MDKIRKKEALDYHEQGRRGKLEIVPTKPHSSQRDLALAYSPGVAEPVLAISENPEDVYRYTAKGNLVAIISNGTAILGLGNLGPEASKPVMEGKGMLFKIFADIDGMDIEVKATDVEEFITTVKNISPTFGGINLEDIKAPEAFEIEERLKAELDSPVMHDDQHGTAIISSASLINALEIAGKDISKVRIVVSGAGAAAISCINLIIQLGASPENISMFDSKGHIHEGRTDIDHRKRKFATKRRFESLSEAMKGADVFFGLSQGNILDVEDVINMAEDPIVFAMANPNPEIAYEKATEARKDIIMATGRSDHPNQVNNVLGFPFIFRGALDVRATCINDEMKLAAVMALAQLAKESVPEEVIEAYDLKSLTFGREYIIPKPLDPRLISVVSMAVARAAIESGVARREITDWNTYRTELMSRMGRDNSLSRGIAERALKSPKKVVFAEGDNYKILKAADAARDEGFAIPVLLGAENKIRKLIQEMELGLSDAIIIDPRDDKYAGLRQEFAEAYFNQRMRKGVTLEEAVRLMRERSFFGTLMVQTGMADAMISGMTRNYPKVIKPALQIIGPAPGVKRVCGMYIVQTPNGPLFFADTTVNVNPTAEDLVEITLRAAETISRMKIIPRIAMLSFSNFGSSDNPDAEKVAKAVNMLHRDHPELIVDGEIQANFALNPEMLNENFPFSRLKDMKVNTLIFPNLAAGNIAYKLLQEIAGMEVIGPILLGMKKSYHILQMGCSVREIINMVRIAVVDSQMKAEENKENLAV